MSAPRRLPPWLKVKWPGGENYLQVKGLLRHASLNTVCEEAHCPNIGECFEARTATFLILGQVCTRNCGFCAVRTGHPSGLDTEEPARVAEAVHTLGLRHAVITSVTRDDLADGGAAIFAETIRHIRAQAPHCRVEVLIPDFGGSQAALQTVLDAHPDILNHNIETVPRLYPRVRPRADYRRSLELLRQARAQSSEASLAKSGIMVGLGETWDELTQVMDDLRKVGADVLTIGQYLSPSARHLPVVRFYTPEEFDLLRQEGERRGFAHVESGPLVRSSYHAHRQVPPSFDSASLASPPP